MRKFKVGFRNLHGNSEMVEIEASGYKSYATHVDFYVNIVEGPAQITSSIYNVSFISEIKASSEAPKQ